jgi:hypothetical protein
LESLKIAIAGMAAGGLLPTLSLAASKEGGGGWLFEWWQVPQHSFPPHVQARDRLVAGTASVQHVTHCRAQVVLEDGALGSTGLGFSFCSATETIVDFEKGRRYAFEAALMDMLRPNGSYLVSELKGERKARQEAWAVYEAQFGGWRG